MVYKLIQRDWKIFQILNIHQNLPQSAIYAALQRPLKFFTETMEMEPSNDLHGAVSRHIYVSSLSMCPMQNPLFVDLQTVLCRLRDGSIFSVTDFDGRFSTVAIAQEGTPY